MIIYGDECCHKPLALPGRLFCFFRLKISKFSSKSQNLPKMGCLRIQDRFKTNLHALKTHMFLLRKNINFCHIFDDLGDTLAGGKSGIFISFSKVNLGSYRKKWPKSVEFLVLGIPWLGSLRQNDLPLKNDGWIRQCVQYPDPVTLYSELLKIHPDPLTFYLQSSAGRLEGP